MMTEAELFDLTRKAEEALVGAVLKRGSLFDAASEMVHSEDIYTTSLRYVWEAFECLKEQDLNIDLVTVSGELQKTKKLDELSAGVWNGVAYLSSLMDNAEPRHYSTYAQQVSDFAASRNIELAMHKALSQRYEGRPAQNIMTDLNTELSKITIFSNVDEYTTTVKDAVSSAYDMTMRAAAGEQFGIMTGFTDLDDMLNGLLPTNFYIAAARPGQGKTALLITVALYAASQGKKVVIFSLEMSRDQLAHRMLSQVSLVDLSKIIKGKGLESEEWTALNNAVEILEGYGIVINDLSSINTREIRRTSRKLKAQGECDLILVDYIQLAQPDDLKKAYNREQEVSQISRGLKWLARELEVPVLAAAQLSRAVEQRANKRPVLSDLRESGTLEQDAFAVLFIYQNEEELGDRANVRELILAKNRNGATGSSEVLWDAPRARFLNGASRVEFRQ